jgi:anthranilate phosphoribosyltransferase
MFAHTLRLLGSRQAYVVHGHDGLDEISVCAPTRISELKEGQVRTFNLDPEAHFDALADPGDLVGGDPATNAAITRRILDGETGPRRNVVLLNAAAALTAAGKATDFADGIGQAAQAIDSGAAREKLAALAAFTQEHAP